MDTKLKKSSGRKATCITSSVLTVISATVTFLNAFILYAAYELKYFRGGWDENGNYDMANTFTMTVKDSVFSWLWVIEIAASLVFAISLVIAIMKCGRKDDNGRIQLNGFDKMFTDIQILAGIGIGCLSIPIGYMMADVVRRSSWVSSILNQLTGEQYDQFIEYSWWWSNDFQPYWVECVATLIFAAAMMAAEVILILAIAKKLKAHEFWKKTIIGRIWCHVYESAKGSNDIFWKVLLVAVIACLLSATWVGTILVLILIFIFVPKWVKKYQAVRDGVNEIKNGNLDYKIPVDDNGELDRLAMSINEISQASSIAIQNEVKSQRLKTDLISNVSHDLKTPLTSMVSYVDLLKREGLDSENAPEYLNIVEEKTMRLQKLTEDLFEAAKASSGAIPVNMEKIEMTSIVNQALGEMGERLDANNLQVIFSPKAEINFVMADGQLLWRVIENLLVNASKYALPGSRVYMDISELDDQNILLEVKNMSKEPLNISADELMERFKRGDVSRNTEGSGLGLAIAKDLTNLMGGEFTLTIDGDLFKVAVALKKVD